MRLKPTVTEKAVMMIESKNVLVFETDKNIKKEEIKKEIESLFKVKVNKVRTLIRENRKYSYVTLDRKNPAIDVATKLGII